MRSTLAADALYEGRVTVLVLWDKKLGTIVKNESAEIIRILNSQLNDLRVIHRILISAA